MSSREISDAKNGITSRREYGFRDPVVRSVVDKFVSRSNVGYSKYGTTVDDERRLKMKGLQKYLNDVQEEMGELAKATLEKDQDEIIDAIGDMVVVLTNLAHLNGLTIEQCIASAYNEISGRKGKMINGTFVKD